MSACPVEAVAPSSGDPPHERRHAPVIAAAVARTFEIEIRIAMHLGAALQQPPRHAKTSGISRRARAMARDDSRLARSAIAVNDDECAAIHACAPRTPRGRRDDVEGPRGKCRP